MADLSHNVYYSKKDSKIKINATLTNLNNPEDTSILNNIFFTAGYDDPNHVGVTITGSGVKDDLTADMVESVQVSANTIFWEMRYESNTENNTVNGIINVSNADYLEYPFVFENKKTIQQTEYHNSITDITESGGTVWFALMMYDQNEVLEDTPMNEVFESVAFDNSILLPYSTNYKHKEIEQHSTSTMVNSSASQYKDFYVDRFVTNYQTYFSQNDLHNAKIVLYFGIFNVEQANTINVSHSLDLIDPTTFAASSVLPENLKIVNAFESNGVYKTGQSFQIGLENIQNNSNNYFMEIDIDGNKTYQIFESNTALVSLSSIEKRTHTIRVFDESGIYMTDDPIVVDCEYNTVKKREFVQKEFENPEVTNPLPYKEIVSFG